MIKYISYLASFLLIIGCSNNPDFNIENPDNYTFSRDGLTTVSYSGQSTRIAMGEELINALSDKELAKEALLAMFSNPENSSPFSNEDLNESTKSIKSKVASSNDFFLSNTIESAEVKGDFENWITAQVEEVFPSYELLADSGKAGQIADASSTRYVNSKGLEYNQVINKALIGALMTDQMLNNYLSPSVLDASNNRDLNDSKTPVEGKSYTNMEHKWDEAYGYLFGASSDGTNPIGNLEEDSFLNKYLKRVNDDEDFNTIAANIFEAFKLGRAAIVAGDYNTRDQQAEIIKELISTVIAVRAVYYLQAGKNALPVNGNNYGPSFHDLSEGYGFIYSLQFTRKPNSSEPYFTRTEVKNYLEQLQEGNGFWDLTPSALDNISEEIADKFDFTVEMAGS